MRQYSIAHALVGKSTQMNADARRFTPIGRENMPF